MYSIRAMHIADYDPLIELMRRTPGVVVRDADSRAATERYLARNPGLSAVAECDGRIVACLMAGHDGRRGYLQHLLVRDEFRRQGIAGALVDRCLEQLAALGIAKNHVDVLTDNAPGAAFWSRRGWTLRRDIDRYSHIGPGGENA